LELQDSRDARKTKGREDNMKRFNSLLLLVAAFVMASSVQSYAAPTAAIGFNWTGGPGYDLIVTDNGIGDLDSTIGSIAFDGALGTAFKLNLTGGITKPVIGLATLPMFDLSSLNVSSSGSGATLRIDFFDTGFTYNGILDADVGGTTNGLATFSILKNDSSILGIGPFSPTSFSGAGKTNVALLPSDIITLEAIINHGGGKKSTSFDFATTAETPIPAAAWLLGSGLRT
jgi:hypothetical protein